MMSCQYLTVQYSPIGITGIAEQSSLHIVSREAKEIGVIGVWNV